MLVFDASTLILPAKVDLLLPVLVCFPSSLAPESVRKETTGKDTFDAKAIAEYITQGKLVVVEDPESRGLKRLMRDFPIGRGEAAAILTARAHNGILATDDGLAIKICKMLGIGFATAVHFLIGLRSRGSLDEELALAKLELLKQFGRYSPRIMEDAARRIRGRGDQ